MNISNNFSTMTQCKYLIFKLKCEKWKFIIFPRISNQHGALHNGKITVARYCIKFYGTWKKWFRNFRWMPFHVTTFVRSYGKAAQTSRYSAECGWSPHQSMQYHPLFNPFAREALYLLRIIININFCHKSI